MAISISDQSLCDLWTESRQRAQSADPYDECDRDRIHAAKAILQRQFHNPPSLQALARQVGLNDCTVKLGCPR